MKHLQKNNIFIKHIKINTGHKTYKCDFCSKVLSKAELKRHIDFHSGVNHFNVNFVKGFYN